LTRIYEHARPVPEGIIIEDYTEDVEIGLLKTGKEADVLLIERLAPDRSCLLAEKRYRPPEQRAFRNDLAYRAHRRIDGKRRDGDRLRKPTQGRALQLAMDRKSRFGRSALADRWIAAEETTLRRAWEAGATVPFVVSRAPDGILMEYVGDRDAAAPRLAQYRAERGELRDLFEQLRANLLVFARIGIVHADLSAYNLLVWEGRLWVIDLPQAVPYLDNDEATDFLHRDVFNVCSWFLRKGLEIDPEELFVEVVNALFDHQMQDLFRAH